MAIASASATTPRVADCARFKRRTSELMSAFRGRSMMFRNQYAKALRFATAPPGAGLPGPGGVGPSDAPAPSRGRRHRRGAERRIASSADREQDGVVVVAPDLAHLGEAG